MSGKTNTTTPLNINNLITVIGYEYITSTSSEFHFREDENRKVFFKNFVLLDALETSKNYTY